MALPIPFPTNLLIEKKTNTGYARNLWAPSSIDYKVYDDGFFGDALDAIYPAAKTNGTSAAVTFTEHSAGGFLKFISGTADDGYAGQGLGLHFTGDRGILMEAIFKTPAAITTLKFEIGLSDADDDAGAINAKATASLTAADCAVLVFDTDDDTNWAAISAKGGTATSTQDISDTPVAAATVYRVAIRVEGDSVGYYINGTQVAGHPNAVEGGTALTPWFFCQARAGSASRQMELIRWRVLYPAY